MRRNQKEPLVTRIFTHFMFPRTYINLFLFFAFYVLELGSDLLGMYHQNPTNVQHKGNVKDLHFEWGNAFSQSNPFQPKSAIELIGQ